MTNVTLFQPFHINDLQEAITHNRGYSFTFGTTDADTFNLAIEDHRLRTGFEYDLRPLKANPLPNNTPQKAALNQASGLIDRIWLTTDIGSGQILGHHNPPKPKPVP